MAAGPTGSRRILARIAEHEAALSRTERRVAQFFAYEGADTVLLSASELGRRTRTSDATVIRTAKTLGFSGLPELKHELGAELMATTHPAKRLASRLSATRDSGEARLVDTVVADATERLRELQRLHADAEFARAIELIDDAGTVMTFGIGISRVVAEYLAVRLGRLGKSTRFAGHMGFAFADDLLQLRAGDAVVVFFPGRVVREIDALFERCRDVGAAIIVVTGGVHDDDRMQPDVYVRAPGSAGGITGETLTASIVSDLMVLAVGERSEKRATETSTTLTRIRRSAVAGMRDRRK